MFVGFVTAYCLPPTATLSYPPGHPTLNRCGDAMCGTHNHMRLCGGQFEKIKEPTPRKKKRENSRSSADDGTAATAAKRSRGVRDPSQPTLADILNSPSRKAAAAGADATVAAGASARTLIVLDDSSGDEIEADAGDSRDGGCRPAGHINSSAHVSRPASSASAAAAASASTVTGTPAVEPCAASLQMLQGMGFAPERARRALCSAENNIELATAMLLSEDAGS